jgi:hypothetical protein
MNRVGRSMSVTIDIAGHRNQIPGAFERNENCFLVYRNGAVDTKGMAPKPAGSVICVYIFAIAHELQVAVF